MRFPVRDWEFWLATLMALLAAVWLLRGVIPWRRIMRRPAKRRGKRATLTLDGVPIERSRGR